MKKSSTKQDKVKKVTKNRTPKKKPLARKISDVASISESPLIEQFHQSFYVFYETAIRIILSNEESVTDKIDECILSYIIIAGPFLPILCQEEKNEDQMKHDLYILTKHIIVESDISPTAKTYLLRYIRNNDTYKFPARVYKSDHLEAFKPLLFSVLGVSEKNQENGSIISFRKTFVPLIAVLILLVPVVTNEKGTEILGLGIDSKDFAKHSFFIASCIFDVLLYSKVFAEKALDKEVTEASSGMTTSIIRFLADTQKNTRKLKETLGLIRKVYGSISEKGSFRHCALAVDTILQRVDTELKVLDRE